MPSRALLTTEVTAIDNQTEVTTGTTPTAISSFDVKWIETSQHPPWLCEEVQDAQSLHLGPANGLHVASHQAGGSSLVLQAYSGHHSTSGSAQ